jgi:hypothetical protein
MPRTADIALIAGLDLAMPAIAAEMTGPVRVIDATPSIWPEPASAYGASTHPRPGRIARVGTDKITNAAGTAKPSCWS